MFTEIETDNLNEIIAQNDLVFVQYAASWCGNCRIIKPKFKAIAEEKNDVATFVIVDAEKYPESRKLAHVTNLPTFAVFKKGQLANQLQTNKANALQEFIDNEITGN